MCQYDVTLPPYPAYTESRRSTVEVALDIASINGLDHCLESPPSKSHCNPVLKRSDGSFPTDGQDLLASDPLMDQRLPITRANDMVSLPINSPINNLDLLTMSIQRLQSLPA